MGSLWKASTGAFDSLTRPISPICQSPFFPYLTFQFCFDSRACRRRRRLLEKRSEMRGEAASRRRLLGIPSDAFSPPSVDKAVTSSKGMPSSAFTSGGVGPAATDEEVAPVATKHTTHPGGKERMGPMGYKIEEVLEAAFSPCFLRILDKSTDKQKKDPKATAVQKFWGDQNFEVVIVSEAFERVEGLKRQRMVYEALKEEMATIHALSMTALAPGEPLPAPSQRRHLRHETPAQSGSCAIESACVEAADASGASSVDGCGVATPLCAATRATNTWFERFHSKLDGWWALLAFGEQQALGNCLGALAIHLGSRFDAAYNAWRALQGKPPKPPPAPRAVAEPGCEWIGEGARLSLPELPPFPSDFDAFEAPVLPLPRLLPQWQRSSWLNSLGAREQMVAQTTAGEPQLQWAMAGVGAAGGAAAVLVAAGLVLGRLRGRGGDGSTLGRLAMRTRTGADLSSK